MQQLERFQEIPHEVRAPAPACARGAYRRWSPFFLEAQGPVSHKTFLSLPRVVARRARPQRSRAPRAARAGPDLRPHVVGPRRPRRVRPAPLDPSLPSRTNWTRLVPPSRTNWTRLVPPPRTKWTRTARPHPMTGPPRPA